MPYYNNNNTPLTRKQKRHNYYERKLIEAALSATEDEDHCLDSHVKQSIEMDFDSNCNPQ